MHVPVGFLGAGLAATGLVLALDRRRRTRDRRREPGGRPAPRPPRVADAERSLRETAERQQPDVDRLDMAMRLLGTALAGCGAPLPEVHAVQLNDDGIQLLLADPMPDPPAPFAARDDGWVWTIPTGAIDGHGRADGLSPLPSLVTVGTGPEGTILVDVETAGSIELTGGSASALLTGFAVELATTTWADHLDVILVGADVPALPGLGRVRRAPFLAGVLPELEASAERTAAELAVVGLPSTLAARSTPMASDPWAPTIVLCSDPPDEADAARLTALTGKGGKGFAVVSVGPLAGARWNFQCGNGVVAMAPLGLRVRSAAPDAEEVDVITALLETGERDIGTADVSPGAEPTSETDDASPEAPAVCGPFQPGVCEVEVRVLGPVEIVGSDEPLDGGKPAEIVAYLATHPVGIDGDRLRTALWPADRAPSVKTFANTVSNTRQLLGAKHFPHATNDLYQLAATVTTDLARLEAIVSYARRQNEACVIPTLRSALELVRGIPFTVVHGFHWARPDGLVAHAQAVVVEAAHRLAVLCLEGGDPAGADWAARQGLLASPGHEALYRDRMAAADAAGNPAGVEEVMRELCEAVEAGNPYDTLHPDTITTYEKLTRRHRGQ